MVLIFIFCLLGVLYLNRILYVQSLLLAVQLRLYQIALAHRKRRLPISENFRRSWVWVSRIFPGSWRQVCHFAQPATILDWSKRRYNDYWTLIVAEGKPSGRPHIPDYIQRFIARVTRENPRKALRWKEFLKLNLPNLAAMDFFVIPRFGRSLLYGFFVIQHERRKLLAINVTAHPTTEWIIQQLVIAFMGQNHSLRFLLSDNDQLYRFVGDFVEDTLGIRQVRTQVASPWQNGIAERLIRTLRNELLDFMLPLSETVIRQRLLDYQKYYNEYHTHSSIDLDSPEGRETGPPAGENIRLFRRKVLGGLHSTYHWRAA